jgi:hypothetical protein
MVSAAVMPNYMSYFKGVLSELGSPLRDQVSIKRTDYLPGGYAVFELTTPDYHTLGGRRPQYDRLKALLQKQIQQDVDKRSGLAMMDIASVPAGRQPPSPSPGPKPIPVTGDVGVAVKPSKPTMPFEQGRDIEILLSDAAMQSSDVKSALAKGGSIGDLLIYDLIDEGIQQFERARDSYSKNADNLAKQGVSIKAFYHPLQYVMKDPLKVATDKAALQKGMIVEGNRIVIPSTLITPTLRPFFDTLLIPKPSYTVRFITPDAAGRILPPRRLPTPAPEPVTIVASKAVDSKAAESPYKNYYIVGGAILLTAGLTAFFMRRR